MNLKGIYLIWEIIEKDTSKYIWRDKKEYINYELTFLDWKYTRTVRTNADTFMKLVKWEKYILPIWVRSFVYWNPANAWTSYFVRKSEIYKEDWELVEFDDKEEEK